MYIGRPSCSYSRSVIVSTIEETRIAPRVPGPDGKRWKRFGKNAKAKHIQNTEHKLLETLWLKAYSDSKLFKPVGADAPATPESNAGARVNITHKQIKKLLQCMVDMFQLKSNLCSMYKDLLELAKHTAIVPTQPMEIVSFENAALVPSSVKRQLLKAFRQDGVLGYRRALRAAEAQEKLVFKPTSDQLSKMLVSDRKTLLPEID